MVGRLFSPEDRARLLRNPNVLRASEKAITYSPDFKVEALRQNTVEGKPPVEIFLDAGFDLDLVGHETPRRCLKRWRKILTQHGQQWLGSDQRGKHSTGRPLKRELTVEDKLRRAEARIRYLEKENEFLKKLDAIERAWLADHPKSTH
ncbi:MAG: HTH domain-containing protein [Bacillota bacterium]